jgi:hypothetical protein
VAGEIHEVTHFRACCDNSGFIQVWAFRRANANSHHRTGLRCFCFALTAW